MGIAVLLHVVFACIWVGGMFFALLCLRPATADLAPDQRVQLMVAALRRFFPWVLLAILVLLGTGLWMVFSVLGGFRAVGLHIHLMSGVGLLMMLLAVHAWFAPLKRLRRLAAEGHWADAGKNLQQLRLIMTVNLVLGIAVVAIASGGRYFFR